MDDLTSKAATQQGASFSHDNFNNFGNFRIMGLSNDGDDFMRMMQPHLHFTAGGDEPVVESKSQSHGNTEFHHDMEEMKEILKNSTEQSEYKPLTEEEVTALMQESRNVEKDDIHR